MHSSVRHPQRIQSKTEENQQHSENQLFLEIRRLCNDLCGRMQCDSVERRFMRRKRVREQCPLAGHLRSEHMQRRRAHENDAGEEETPDNGANEGLEMRECVCHINDYYTIKFYFYQLRIFTHKSRILSL